MDLTQLFTSIANAIRSKKGTNEKIKAENFPREIEGLSTLSFPMELTDLDGTLQIKIDAKNHFNKNNIVESTWGNGRAGSTILFSNGTIKTVTNMSYFHARELEIAGLKQNTDYTISGVMVSTTAPNGGYVMMRGYNGSTRPTIGTKENIKAGEKFSFTFNTGTYKNIGLSLNGNGSSSATSYITYYDKIQIEEGTEATDYEDYKEIVLVDHCTATISVKNTDKTEISLK